MSILTYVEVSGSVWSLRLRCLNSCSTGFSHGEYWALNKTLTFIFLAVSSTNEWWWITALSMNSTIRFDDSSGSVRTALNVSYTKFSKSTESTAPSIIWLLIILSCETAAINEKLYYCFLGATFDEVMSRVSCHTRPKLHRSHLYALDSTSVDVPCWEGTLNSWLAIICCSKNTTCKFCLHQAGKKSSPHLIIIISSPRLVSWCRGAKKVLRKTRKKRIK